MQTQAENTTLPYSKHAVEQQKRTARLSALLGALCIILALLLAVANSSGVVFSALFGLYWAVFSLYQYRMAHVFSRSTMNITKERIEVRLGASSTPIPWSGAVIEPGAFSMQRGIWAKALRFFPGIRLNDNILVLNRELLLKDAARALPISGTVFALDNEEYCRFIDMCAEYKSGSVADSIEAPEEHTPAKSKKKLALLIAVFIIAGAIILLMPNRRIAIAVFFGLLGFTGLILTR